MKSSHLANTLKYFLKFSIKKYPVRFFFRCLTIGFFYFTIMIKLSEQPGKKEMDLYRWENCSWHVFITMLTIGFGDTTPHTYLGRAFSVLCGIFGYGLFSLLVISFNKFIYFSKEEEKVLTYIGNFLLQDV